MGERLIIEVEKQPTLWDKTEPKYKDLDHRETLWAKIGKLLDMDGMLKVKSTNKTKEIRANVE